MVTCMHNAVFFNDCGFGVHNAANLLLEAKQFLLVPR